MTKPTTVAITVNGEQWNVSRGFGTQYRRVASLDSDPGLTRSLLNLIGYDASVETIAAWSLLKRVEAEVYATNEHLRASDNPIQRHPRPEWMGGPWLGDDHGPTVLK